MAEQLAVARNLPFFRWAEMRVLVERAAGEAELQKAASSSWEHGFIRSSTTTTETLKGRYWVAAGKRTRLIDGRVYVEAGAGGDSPRSVIGHTDYDLIAQSA